MLDEPACTVEYLWDDNDDEVSINVEKADSLMSPFIGTLMAKKTKAHEPIHVHLTETAKEILNRRHAANKASEKKSEYVFPRSRRQRAS